MILNLDFSKSHPCKVKKVKIIRLQFQYEFTDHKSQEKTKKYWYLTDLLTKNLFLKDSNYFHWKKRVFFAIHLVNIFSFFLFEKYTFLHFSFYLFYNRFCLSSSLSSNFLLFSAVSATSTTSPTSSQWMSASTSEVEDVPIPTSFPPDDLDGSK